MWSTDDFIQCSAVGKRPVWSDTVHIPVPSTKRLPIQENQHGSCMGIYTNAQLVNNEERGFQHLKQVHVCFVHSASGA
jgi:hypothetical protein